MTSSTVALDPSITTYPCYATGDALPASHAAFQAAIASPMDRAASFVPPAEPRGSSFRGQQCMCLLMYASKATMKRVHLRCACMHAAKLGMLGLMRNCVPKLKEKGQRMGAVCPTLVNTGLVCPVCGGPCLKCSARSDSCCSSGGLAPMPDILACPGCQAAFYEAWGTATGSDPQC